jgi:hypothetical protein
MLLLIEGQFRLKSVYTRLKTKSSILENSKIISKKKIIEDKTHNHADITAYQFK